VSELLVFDDEPEPRTALWHACTRVPTAAPGESVTAVLSDMAAKRYDCASVVAVLVGGRLVGVAPIERMWRSSGLCGRHFCCSGWVVLLAALFGVSPVI